MNNMSEKILDSNEVTEHIKKALRSMDAEIITKIYNEVCPSRIRYLGDSLWVKES